MNELKGIIEDCYKSDLISKEAIKKIIEIIGQEEWNYLYDENSNICTTMGELIITLKGIPELEKENAELKKRIAELETQIEKMKSDVRGNIKWADQNKNEQMYCKLNAMFNQWEIKEND